MSNRPPPFSVVNAAGAGHCVLICEHASRYIPSDYANLGLAAAELDRHIAWDIGAAELAAQLAARLDAPLFLAGWSRLLIDGNRPLGVPSSIPVRSEATDIPGNVGLSDAERDARAATWFAPFHAAITAALDARQAAGVPTRVIGIHSFTPRFLGVARPWPVAVLYARAADYARRLIDALAASGDGPIGDNEPYRVNDAEDYTVPVHGHRRGLDAVLIEVRQDLLATPAGIAAWAARLAPVLAA